jgi:hypothetical protein
VTLSLPQRLGLGTGDESSERNFSPSPWPPPPSLQLVHDRIEEFGDAGAMLGRDLEDRVDAEVIEIDRAGTSPLVVELVQGQQNGAPGRAQLRRDDLVATDQALASVGDEDQKIRPLDRALSLNDHHIM